MFKLKHHSFFVLLLLLKAKFHYLSYIQDCYWSGKTSKDHDRSKHFMEEYCISVCQFTSAMHFHMHQVAYCMSTVHLHADIIWVHCEWATYICFSLTPQSDDKGLFFRTLGNRGGRKRSPHKTPPRDSPVPNSPTHSSSQYEKDRLQQLKQQLSAPTRKTRYCYIIET